MNKLWLIPSLMLLMSSSASLSENQAESKPATAAPEAKSEAHEEAPAPSASAPLEPSESDDKACLVDRTALLDLEKRRAALDERQKILDAREGDLAAREKVISEQLGMLEEIKKQITGVKEENIRKNEAQIAKIIETIETMSPKSGAALLGGLSDPLAVTVMERVSSPKLAKILAGMDPKKVSHLTELLATGRKTSNPKGGEKGDANTINEPSRGA